MDYTTYIKPELLALVPALYFFAQMMKSSFKLDPHKIPLAIGIASVVLSSIWVLAVSDIAHYKDALMAVFIAIVQGLLCAGATVYAHQLYKQNIKPDVPDKSGGSENTDAKKEMARTE
ncbi:MAG: phage holin family protein [Chitinispirillales bacterium]|jgi:Na+(H+)/acetate symporter ActP|nr:phage holin family protein [Chitinispirillales bacterium]